LIGDGNKDILQEYSFCKKDCAMGVMSIDAFNRNISKAITLAENGEDIVLTRHGKEILRLLRDGVAEAIAAEAQRKASLARMLEIMSKGYDFEAPATYDERTGSDRDSKWD
jgi:antitoxin (DNA-binding transcriptional repressor) of toxin-antitoxin stability system